MTNLRKLPSGDAVTNTETGETVKCDLDAPQNRRAWMAWAATLPPLSVPAGALMDDNSQVTRAWKILGAVDSELVEQSARRVVAELAEAKRRYGIVEDDSANLRAFFDEVGVMLGIKSRDGVTKGEIRVAIEALKSDVVRAGNACFDATARLQKMERELAEAKRELSASESEAAQQRDRAKRAESELEALRAQRERMPAKLVEAAKSYLSSFGDRYLAIHGFGLAGEILRDLAACEPAAMLTVEAAVRVVHDVKRVIVRGTPIPNTVDTFDVEEALRKAAKS